MELSGLDVSGRRDDTYAYLHVSGAIQNPLYKGTLLSIAESAGLQLRVFCTMDCIYQQQLFLLRVSRHFLSWDNYFYSQTSCPRRFVLAYTWSVSTVLQRQLETYDGIVRKHPHLQSGDFTIRSTELMRIAFFTDAKRQADSLWPGGKFHCNISLWSSQAFLISGRNLL